MKPYYDDGKGIVIYHGDCREILPGLPKVDLVLTDPPYGIGDSVFAQPNREGKRIGAVNTWHDKSDWDKQLILPDISASVIAWWGHWRKRIEVSEKYGEPRCEIIWAKDCHVGPPCPAAMRDERMWVFSEKPFEPRRFETTVWDEPIIPTWDHKWHKNEKPIQLMTRCLEWLPGDTVLDPFLGSGTTLRSAKDLGRRAIGIEIEERYCEIAARRLSQEVFDFNAVNVV
jgi:site-specific DNA-methyltransferase (adenine-specific)